MNAKLRAYVDILRIEVVFNIKLKKLPLCGYIGWPVCSYREIITGWNELSSSVLARSNASAVTISHKCVSLLKMLHLALLS